MNKVIIYDNNESYVTFIAELLTGKGYDVVISSDEFNMIEKASECCPKLIITSYSLTSLDGETFFKTIRGKYPDLPVLFISNVRDEEIIASMMSYPRCDFMVKPIVPEELTARIKILTGEEPLKQDYDEKLLSQAIEIDRKTKTVKKENEEIALTPTEFRLLEYLMMNKNTVLSRERILNEIWETNQDVTDRIVDVYIGYLREKMDPEGNLIITVQGFGYKLAE